jgi:hypothetical protein
VNFKNISRTGFNLPSHPRLLCTLLIFAMFSAGVRAPVFAAIQNSQQAQQERQREEEERQRQAEQERQREAQEERQREAQEERQREAQQAQEERQREAQEERQREAQQAQEERQREAQQEQQRRAEQERQEQAQQEQQRRAEQERQQAAQQEQQRRAEQDRQQQAQQEEQRQAELARQRQTQVGAVDLRRGPGPEIHPVAPAQPAMVIPAPTPSAVVSSPAVGAPVPAIMNPVYIPAQIVPQPAAPSSALVMSAIAGQQQDTQAATAAAQSLAFQQMIANQTARMSEIDAVADAFRMVIIQTTSDPELAQALTDQIGKPDPLQQALTQQLQNMASVSQANAQRGMLQQQGALQQGLLQQIKGGTPISQPNLQRVGAPSGAEQAIPRMSVQFQSTPGTPQRSGQKLPSAASIIACSNSCMRNPTVNQFAAQCKAGSAASCYRAAAALCQCNLSSGGCGGNAQQLQACVSQNTQDANSLLSRSVPNQMRIVGH